MGYPLSEFPRRGLELFAGEKFRPPLHRWSRVPDRLCVHQSRSAKAVSQISRRGNHTCSFSSDKVFQKNPLRGGKTPGAQIGLVSVCLCSQAGRFTENSESSRCLRRESKS